MTSERAFRTYEIGTPGQPWGDAERTEWRSRQTVKRSYTADVRQKLTAILAASDALQKAAEVVEYGQIDYRALLKAVPDADHFTYTMVAVKSRDWVVGRPVALVTGGVHGYETSGVHGALLFIQTAFVEFSEKKAVNLLVLPCISPWGYETINRWNPDAIDPNRSFNAGKPGCQEAALAMSLIQSLTGVQSSPVLVHTDLHETTDTDNSEFTPAKFARDGSPPDDWSEIPDGFYLVGDSDRPQQIGFHRAMLDAVRRVTHIAPCDEKGALIGVPAVEEGLVDIPCKNLFLCAAQTAGPFVVTTEVYPDSPKTNAEECNRAQVACVVAGINYALSAGVKL
jgi:hypothetical protein